MIRFRLQPIAVFNAIVAPSLLPLTSVPIAVTLVGELNRTAFSSLWTSHETLSLIYFFRYRWNYISCLIKKKYIIPNVMAIFFACNRIIDRYYMNDRYGQNYIFYQDSYKSKRILLCGAWVWIRFSK